MTRTVTPDIAARWLASGEAILIDVREADEFTAEHIACAASVPLSAAGDIFRTLPVPADRKVIFQCEKGSRGEAACRAAGQSGSGHDLYNLDGGLSGWKSAGLPVVGKAGRRATISLFRQVQIVVGLMLVAAIAAGFSGWQAGFALAGLIGAMLAFAGMTGWCGMAMLLGRMPWNRAA